MKELQIIKWCRKWFTIGDYVAILFFIIVTAGIWIVYLSNN